MPRLFYFRQRRHSQTDLNAPHPIQSPTCNVTDALMRHEPFRDTWADPDPFTWAKPGAKLRYGKDKKILARQTIYPENEALNLRQNFQEAVFVLAAPMVFSNEISDAYNGMRFGHNKLYFVTLNLCVNSESQIIVSRNYKHIISKKGKRLYVPNQPRLL
jgi:hypothetical protein